MRQLFTIAALLVAAACGASFKGPDLTGANDRCQGHLDCGRAGCCMDANSDGAGYSCNEPGSQFGACSPVGLAPTGDQSGEFAAKRRDAGATDASPSAPEPDDPNLGEPPPGHGGQG